MDIFKLEAELGICDIGASPVEPTPFIDELCNSVPSVLYGFEPNKEDFDKLEASENKKFFNYGIGDGETKELNICKASGMSSFLKPKLEYLKYFHHFEDWAEIIKTVEVETTKLDDVEFKHTIDLFKIDVQGYESEIIKYGQQKLREAVCIQLESSPVPIYQDEKPFSYIAAQLEDLGFMLHSFYRVDTRAFKPIVIGQDSFAGLNHLFQMDCVFIRRIEDLSKFSDLELHKLAAILFYAFKSFDIVHMLLSELDRRKSTNLAAEYLNQITAMN